MEIASGTRQDKGQGRTGTDSEGRGRDSKGNGAWEGNGEGSAAPSVMMNGRSCAWDSGWVPVKSYLVLSCLI